MRNWEILHVRSTLLLQSFSATLFPYGTNQKGGISVGLLKAACSFLACVYDVVSRRFGGPAISEKQTRHPAWFVLGAVACPRQEEGSREIL